MTTQDRLDVLNLNEREVTEEYRAGKIDLATFTRRRAYYRGKIEGLMTGETQRMEEQVERETSVATEKVENTDDVERCEQCGWSMDSDGSETLCEDCKADRASRLEEQRARGAYRRLTTAIVA